MRVGSHEELSQEYLNILEDCRLKIDQATKKEEVKPKKEEKKK